MFLGKEGNKILENEKRVYGGLLGKHLEVRKKCISQLAWGEKRPGEISNWQ